MKCEKVQRKARDVIKDVKQLHQKGRLKGLNLQFLSRECLVTNVKALNEVNATLLTHQILQ